MRKTEQDEAKRLIPAAPPQRLPEEALLAKLKRDKAYRRNASLLRSLLYQPQRLFTSGAPSRLPPARTLRELRYRLVAVVTSLALLVGMVNFAPFNIFSLVGKSKADSPAAAPDYSWLTDVNFDGTTADKAYQIGTPNQLYALSLLVAGLAPSDVSTFNLGTSDSPSMEITIDGYTFIVGPDQENVLPPAFSSDTPEVPEASPSIVPSVTPSAEPSDEPTVEPTVAPTTEPTTEPTVEPTVEPTSAPTTTPSTEPSQTPPVESPSHSPSAEPSPSPTVEPSVVPTAEPSTEVSAEARPLALSLRSATPTEHVEDSTPTPSPSEDAPQPSAPKESEEPAPSESVEPTPSTSHSPEPTPSDSAEPSPSVSESPSPSQSGEVTPPPSPTNSQPTETAPVPTGSTPLETTPPPEGGNSLPLPDSGVEARVYSLNIPTGMLGRFFKLTDNISLYLYRGRVGADQGEEVYWTPIGTLKSISSTGVPAGAPFLGDFNGNGKTVYNFYYAPDPTLIDPAATEAAEPGMAGYGLFGYIGDSGKVHDLTVRTADKVDDTGVVVPWDTATMEQETKDLSLGARNYAVGVLAAASSGTLSGCTIAQTQINYGFKPTLNAVITAVGGAVGLVGGGSLDNCVFLGSISNAVQNVTTDRFNGNVNVNDTNTYTRQAVGGMAGYVSGNAALVQCATGAELDIYNGGLISKFGGVGGLLGYSSSKVSMTSCFTTGVIRSSHNAGGMAGCTTGTVTVSSGYSTAALGSTQKNVSTVYNYKTNDGKDASTTDSVVLSLSTSEAIGGLFGRISGSGSKLENTYFAGSLLESQFGAVAGWAEVAPTLTNVAVDATQAPHDYYKTGTEPTSKVRNLSGFISGWTIASGHTPQPIWTSPSAALTALSQAASLQWAAVNTSNTYDDGDGLRTLYQLTDTAVDGSAFLGASRASTYYASDGTTPIGGEYLHTATVEGTPIPLRRCAVTAINTSDGAANTIDSGIALVRFANRVNLAPGGYNGSQYLFTTFDAGAAAIPAYGKNTIKLFCGTLTGGAGAVVSNFTYASGASGIIDTGCDALLDNFMLSDIKIGNVPLGTDSRYFGAAVGQVIRTDFTNVDLNKLEYQYSGSDYTSTTSFGLVGSLPLASTRRIQFANCDATDLNISIVGNTSLGLNIGGVLGYVEGSGSGQSFTMINCTMTGTIYTNLTVSPSNAPGSYPTVGGLVGYDNDSYSRVAIFNNCVVNADLTGLRVGGLIGRARAAQMDQCAFSGKLSTSDKYATASSGVYASGGLIGANEHSSAAITINNCAVFGNISSRYNAGGFIGYTQKAPTITSSYASAIVSANLNGGAAGGMVGYHDASNSFSATNSYFTGQVLSPDTKGAIIGLSKIVKSTKPNVPTPTITLTNTLYDSTLFPTGTKTVGSVSADIPVVECAARPGDAVWTTLATAGGWTYSTADRHYPQLPWLKTALPTLSSYSTLQLFDVTALTNIHNIPLGTTFHTILPVTGGVTGTPAPKEGFEKIPFVQDGAPALVGDYTSTPYLTNDADITEGLLKFTYTGMGPGNTKLELPYIVGIKLFDQGKGTESEPYIIYDLSQLLIFRGFVNSSKNTPNVYYKIGGKLGTEHADESITIDMTDSAGDPLDWRGTLSALDGQLDGNGSTLTNFHTTGWTVKTGDTTVWSAGLLGGMTSNSSVKDLTILGAESGAIVSGTGRSGTSHSAGILSATAGGGTVSGVTAKGSITVDRDINVGGLIGSANVTQPLSISNCVTDVNIQAATNEDGSDSAGSGGIIGYTTASSAASITLSECATYGSMVDWGNMGGLVGRSSNSNSLQLTLQNSYSLMALSDSGISVADSNKSAAAVRCGGIVGGVDSLNVLDSSRVIIDSCYYAGENAMSGSGRVVGGFVGGAMATISGQDNKLQNNGRDYLKLNIKNSSYNTDSNKAVPAYLYYKDAYQSRYGWPETYWDGAGDIASDNNYGTHYRGKATSFGMSQDANSSELETTMKSWNSTNTWSFSNGLYPLLKNSSVTSDLAFQHLAIHYTKADGVDRYANVFVRYTGAKMSTDCASLLVTENQRMAVAIDNNTANAKAPDNVATITITATIMGVTGTHTLNIIPSVDSRGYRDASIYYANPNGMWPTKDGEKVWRVYTADALAGLSTVFSKDTVDQNGILQLAPGAMAGGEVWLGRDIDLGQSYYGMGEYNSWRPIGGDTADTAFNITLDGKGHTLYNLAMNPFIQTQDGNAKTATYKDMTSSQQGLFGTIDGGTVKNLVLVANSSAATSVYRQPGIRIGMNISAAGALAATMKSGTLENCLVSIPVYTMGTTPTDTALSRYTEIWTAVPYLGAAKDVPMGGLVGRVTGTAAIKNCAYTGYVYADPKSPRPGSDSPASTDLAGPVGGLVGRVSAGATLTVSDSYAAGYVHGAQTGALVGANLGTVALSGASYDQNAAGGATPPIGAKTDDSTVTGSAAPQVPALIGADWQTDTPEGLYPIQSALAFSPDTLAAYPDTLAARIRIALTPHASSATGGTLSYTADGSSLVYDATLQSAVAAIPGSVVLKDNSFAKQTDGLVQLELTQNASARRVLINLRCWYDDATETDGIKHYTISTAEELWELSQIVSGAITSSDLSKVAHTHAPIGGFDTFSGAVIHLADDIDLTTLTDTVDNVTSQRPWLPIGSTHAFAGTLLGNGHSVSGLLLSDVAEAGLFGTVSGTVQDLLVTNAALTLPTAPNAAGGLLCARLTPTGKLTYCGASGTASASGSGATLGGIVGVSQGVVVGCFSTVELTSSATGSVGGIAGSVSGASAEVEHSYFTGYANALSASTGGIAGDNIGAAVSDCYVSAYLTGRVIYRAAKDAVNCVYDGRHTGTLNDTDTATARKDGAGLIMYGDWTENKDGYYPIPLYYTLSTSSSPDIVGSALARAAKLAAGIFTFSGASNASYGRFNTVSVEAVSTGVSFLRSGNANLLSVSGNEAYTVAETSGNVVLRFCLGTDGQSAFQRPCWLTIPSALAVTYRFNWEYLITEYHDDVTANADYHTGSSGTNTWSSTGYSHTISTAGDWTKFTEFANSHSTVDHTFTLDYDINFSGAAIPTVTAPFYGTFNGGNHTLSNFSAGAPLFAGVEQGAKVEYLGISEGTVTISARGTLDAGVVAGRNAGRIANVSAEHCTLAITQSNAAAVTSAGSLVGQNTGMLDSCYYYVTGAVGNIQMSVDCPAGTALPSLRMGGLAGYNSGTVKGCYSTLSMSLRIGTGDSGLSTHFASLVGLNDGGSILYSYWRYPYTYSGASETYAAYVNSDGTRVLAKDLFLGNDGYTEQTARWLSADSYGGTYYVSDGHLMLYSFRLARYDFSKLFGTPMQQYLMLGLQFDSPASGSLFSNAVCSWKGPVLPNFADLPLTSSLSVRLPILSEKLTYSLAQVYVIHKGTKTLGQMGEATFGGTAQSGYSVTSLGDNATRVFLDLKLEKATADDRRWGVYRKDSTLPETLN